MNKSIFLTSFLSNHWRGSKFLTSAAILVENCVVSKREIIETPLRPSQRPFHVSSVPVPSAVTNPTPVTTTLLFCKIKKPLKLRLWKMVLDVFDRVFDCSYFFRFFIGNFQTELFFQLHHQFNGVQRIGAEIIDERCSRRDFRFVDAELFNNDLF